MRFERDGTRLAYEDFGGTGPPVLLLHGLAGYAGEWRRSAARLVDRARVFALDQRGHGDSERYPRDVSRAAYTEDVVALIDHLGLGPLILVGQSMGAVGAILTAARYPERVSRLVVIEGSPDGPEPPEPNPPAAEAIRDSLARWPVPFADAADARQFFASKGLDPAAWTAGLERREGGLWPRFDVDTLGACMADLASRSYWEQWRSIRCPTLVILGERGMFGPQDGARMAAELPGAELHTITGAGHDVHLDAPDAWVAKLVLWMDAGERWVP